jgi:hypothetical protein
MDSFIAFFKTNINFYLMILIKFKLKIVINLVVKLIDMNLD